ncbi:DUF3761 domain-containing protein [Sphingomonas lycopersici]|uniref:DUF3761 domain-containing protein n=1 Tax=Sphingomonas lycopersici TaxID=2951807 RepID=A0AA42CSD1_9SPHN|nr:DUF3761 domain-containing protein [Sphingomonas lycopersici]MCW6537635.1 DUF3761 domain-containing protein [Sphingomonas lycopersici]
MKRILLAVSGLLMVPLALSAVPAHAQAARNYDCTKPGNANKTACKSAGAAAAKPAPKARNYDCTKPGNANKAACKAAAASAAPAPAAAKPARNYDCSKAGNANKAVCKGVATTAPAPRATQAAPASRPAPAAPTKAAPAPAPRAPVTGQNTNPGGPNGATAKCRDGSYSFSAHRSGTCSRHGGVAQFY